MSHFALLLKFSCIDLVLPVGRDIDDTVQDDLRKKEKKEKKKKRKHRDGELTTESGEGTGTSTPIDLEQPVRESVFFHTSWRCDNCFSFSPSMPKRG